MDSATARSRARKRAIIVGRLLNVLLSGFFLTQGIHRLPLLICWVNFFLAAVFVYRAFTYQPSRTDEAVSQAMGLAWAVMILGAVVPLLLIMMSVGDSCRQPLMWGILLATIFVPGFIVWQYFRKRKA